MNFKTPLLAAGLLASLCFVMPAAGQQANNPTAFAAPAVADFFRHPEVVEMEVSPSGRYAAATVKGGPAKKRRLVIIDLQDVSRSEVVFQFTEADVSDVSWVNDERLVVSASDSNEPYAYRRSQGLFAVDRTGRESPRELISRTFAQDSTSSRVARHVLTPQHILFRTLRDGSNDVLIHKGGFDGLRELQQLNLMRLDTVTGHARNLALGAPANTIRWVTDQAGTARALISVEGERETLYWQGPGEGEWQAKREFARYSAEKLSAPTLLTATADGSVYAIGMAKAGDDVASLLKLRLGADGALETQALITLQGFDFTGTLVLGKQGDLLGVHYLSDARATHWFDPRMKSIQAQVDQLLPGTVNLLDCGQCTNPEKVVVTAYSDRQPRIFMLFDAKLNKLEQLMGSRPWIDSKAMAKSDLVRVKARDGLELPVYITRPQAGNKPAPMVVLVHGGPWVRGGQWGWNAQAQFLASRGYLVVEPEFRGSTGYGSRLYMAGFKQWGLAMQDDVADVAQWAIKQGEADPKRVCIAGASYGGYATFMGLIRNPEIFRCGVSWVGVSDIELMYSINWSDMNENWKRYGMPVLIGDRQKDAEQLARTSPIQLAGRLTQPLLMAYGAADKRVPIEHGRKMRDALAPHNKSVEWVVYPDEGHGWYAEVNSIDFWTRVEAFLDKNLKNAP